MEPKKAWKNPEIIELGVEKTEQDFLGPGNDGAWQESGLFGYDS